MKKKLLLFSTIVLIASTALTTFACSVTIHGKNSDLNNKTLQHWVDETSALTKNYIMNKISNEKSADDTWDSNWTTNDQFNNIGYKLDQYNKPILDPKTNKPIQEFTPDLVLGSTHDGAASNDDSYKCAQFFPKGSKLTNQFCFPKPGSNFTNNVTKPMKTDNTIMPYLLEPLASLINPTTVKMLYSNGTLSPAILSPANKYLRGFLGKEDIKYTDGSKHHIWDILNASNLFNKLAISGSSSIASYYNQYFGNLKSGILSVNGQMTVKLPKPLPTITVNLPNIASGALFTLLYAMSAIFNPISENSLEIAQLKNNILAAESPVGISKYILSYLPNSKSELLKISQKINNHALLSGKKSPVNYTGEAGIFGSFIKNFISGEAKGKPANIDFSRIFYCWPTIAYNIKTKWLNLSLGQKVANPATALTTILNNLFVPTQNYQQIGTSLASLFYDNSLSKTQFYKLAVTGGYPKKSITQEATAANSFICNILIYEINANLQNIIEKIQKYVSKILMSPDLVKSIAFLLSKFTTTTLNPYFDITDPTDIIRQLTVLPKSTQNGVNVYNDPSNPTLLTSLYCYMNLNSAECNNGKATTGKTQTMEGLKPVLSSLFKILTSDIKATGQNLVNILNLLETNKLIGPIFDKLINSNPIIKFVIDEVQKFAESHKSYDLTKMLNQLGQLVISLLPAIDLLSRTTNNDSTLVGIDDTLVKAIGYDYANDQDHFIKGSALDIIQQLSDPNNVLGQFVYYLQNTIFVDYKNQLEQKINKYYYRYFYKKYWEISNIKLNGFEQDLKPEEHQTLDYTLSYTDPDTHKVRTFAIQWTDANLGSVVYKPDGTIVIIPNGAKAFQVTKLQETTS